MDLGYSNSLEPYPGLRPFRKDESDIFFGRDDHIGEMIGKLSESYFLCVAGSSGCGKSSLARTGLMNHLEAGFLAGRGSDWIFCDLHPGDNPVDNLFRAIGDAIVAEVQPDGDSASDRSEQIREFLKNHITTQRRTSDLNKALDLVAGIGERPIMILVDQFEELFRYARSDSEAAVNFVEILLKTAAAKRHIYVVITIRTDELERCSRYPGLTRMINDSQFLTPVLDRYEIQEAIEGPITLWGGSISSAFSTWLLNCLEDELDKLPLMQHALRVLYAAKTSSSGRRDVTIDLGDFLRVFKLPPDFDLSSADGRLALRRSLSDRLTQRYNDLPDRLKPAAKRAFCALTAVDSRNRDIRQPQKLGTLAKIIDASVEDTRVIVRAFSTGDEAYLRCNPDLAEGDTVDVTHECILRLWWQLQAEWLVDEKRSADNIVSLARLARDWSSESENRSVLGNVLAGAALKWYARGRYQEWFDAIRPNPAWAARYLRSVDWPASPNAGAARLSAESIFERISALLAASKRQQRFLYVALFAVVVTAIAGTSYVSFEIASSKARAAQAKSEEIAISGLPQEQTRIANLQSAVQAFDDGLVNSGAIWGKLQQVYDFYRFQAEGEVHAADFAADGKSILAIDIKGTLYQWTIAGERKALRQAVIGARGGDGLRAQGRSLKVSPLGDVAAVGFNDGSVILADLTSTENRFKALQINGANPHGTDSVFNLVFSHDASLLLTSSRAGNIAIWERSSPTAAQSGGPSGGDPLQWTLKQDIDLTKKRRADIWAVDIDRAGQTIAVGLGDGHICLLWLDDLDRPVCPDERTKDKAVKSVKFLPNKPILVSAGNDAKVTIWDLDSSKRSAKPLLSTLDQNNAIWDVDFNRDGTLLATASFDGTVRIYQTDAWRLLSTLAADKIASTRRRRVTGNDTIDNVFALRTVRFDATSTMLVTSSLDHTARVWTPLIDRASIKELGYRQPPAGDRLSRSVYSVAIKPTGDGIAFTDQTAVYVQSAGKPPKPLPVEIDGAPQKPGQASNGVQPLFSQVLMRAPNEVIASAADPRLTVWTLSDRDTWLARSVALPGDPIRPPPEKSKFPGRGAAIDASGAMLAVELRDGEQASILLCPLRGSEAWTCSASGNSAITRLALDAKLLLNPAEKDCASSGSEVHIAVSSGARLVAVSAGRCPVQVFDLHNGNRSRSYTSHNGDINTLDFSPDGKSLVAASQAGEVRVWDLASGTSVNINHHESPFVTAARYSPSGQWIASTSNDNSLVVSSAKSGKQFVVLRYRNSLFDLEIASTPRGGLLVTGSEVGDVNVMPWFENDKDIVSYAKSVLRDVAP